MIEIKTCPTCGSKRIRKVRRTVTRTVCGQTYTVPNLRFYVCPDCGEQLFDPEALAKIETYSPIYKNRLAASRS